MTEPLYKYVKGEGWVPKMNPTPHGEVSPSGRYVVMFRTDSHGWINAKHTNLSFNERVARSEYQISLRVFEYHIKNLGWEFEIWPAEQEVNE